MYDSMTTYLLFFNINQAVVFALILFFLAKTSKPKIMLGIYMVLYAICHALLFYFTTNVQGTYSNISLNLFTLYFPFFAATPVFFYLYIMSVTGKKSSGLKISLHFLIPLLLLFIISFSFLPLSSDDKQQVVQNLFKISLNPGSNDFSRLWHVAMMLIIMQGFIYIFFIFKVIRKNDKMISEHYSYTENLSLNWLKYVFYIFFVSYFVYFIAGNFINDFYTDTSINIAYNINQAIITFLLGFFGIKQERLEISQKKENNLTNFINGEKKNIKMKLLNHMNTKKPHLNPDLRIEKLAQDMETNRSYLSALIKEETGLNFCNFINKYRVEEFIHRYRKQEYDKFNIQGLAHDVGFKSKSSFYQAFKKFKSATPLNYIKDNAS